MMANQSRGAGRLALRALLAWLAGACALAAASPAAARGGGSHYVYVPIIIYHTDPQPRPSPPYRTPPSASLDVEVTDAAPTRMSGTLRPHEAFAVHQFRVRDAVVLAEAVDVGGRMMPAGTVLSRVSIQSLTGPGVAWCDLKAADKAAHGTTYDCLVANTRSGELYGRLPIKAADDLLGVDGGGQPVGTMKMLKAPTMPRKAQPEERPVGQIGYAWCGGGGDADPPRFEVTASLSGGPWLTSSSHLCALGDWANPPRRDVVALDDLRLTLGGGAEAQVMAFTAEGRAQAGPMARLTPGGPLRSESEVIAEIAVTNSPADTVVYDMASRRAADGDVSDGDVLFSIRARMGVTGVLSRDVLRGEPGEGGSTAPVLRAGQPMFAWPSDIERQAELIWCAPLKDDNGVWEKSVCLSNDGRGVYAVDARPPFMPARAREPGSKGVYVNPAKITPSLQTFPVMTVEYVLTNWRDALPDIYIRADWGEGMVFIRQVRSTLQDGAATFAAPGGAVRLVQHPYGAEVRYTPTAPVPTPLPPPEAQLGAVGTQPLTVITLPPLVKPSPTP